MKLRRLKKMDGWYEIKSTCPVCGHTGYCTINEDQSIVYCMRVPSNDFKDTYIGRGFKHVIDPSKIDATKIEIEINNDVDKKPIQHLNRVYRALVSELPLKSYHCRHLIRDRQIEEDAIRLREYKTLPQMERHRITKRVAERLGDADELLGVPGFFVNDGRYGKYWTMAGQTGLLIPYRTVYNQLAGFQIRVDQPKLEIKKEGCIDVQIVKEVDSDREGNRRAECIVDINQMKKMKTTLTVNDEKVCNDKNTGKFHFSVELKTGNKYWWWSSSNKDNGASIGNPLPVHLALPSQAVKYWSIGQNANEIMDCSEVWVTEGALKGDIAADRLVRPFVCIPGTGSYRAALEPLQQLGAEYAVIAYDADIVTNPHVQESLEQFAEFLANNGVGLKLAMWDLTDGKGIDDLLYRNLLPQVATLAEPQQ